MFKHSLVDNANSSFKAYGDSTITDNSINGDIMTDRSRIIDNSINGDIITDRSRTDNSINGDIITDRSRITVINNYYGAHPSQQNHQQLSIQNQIPHGPIPFNNHLIVPKIPFIQNQNQMAHIPFNPPVINRQIGLIPLPQLQSANNYNTQYRRNNVQYNPLHLMHLIPQTIKKNNNSLSNRKRERKEILIEPLQPPQKKRKINGDGGNYHCMASHPTIYIKKVCKNINCNEFEPHLDVKNHHSVNAMSATTISDTKRRNKCYVGLYRNVKGVKNAKIVTFKECLLSLPDGAQCNYKCTRSFGEHKKSHDKWEKNQDITVINHWSKFRKKY